MIMEDDMYIILFLAGFVESVLGVLDYKATQYDKDLLSSILVGIKHVVVFFAFSRIFTNITDPICLTSYVSGSMLGNYITLRLHLR